MNERNVIQINRPIYTACARVLPLLVAVVNLSFVSNLGTTSSTPSPECMMPELLSAPVDDMPLLRVVRAHDRPEIVPDFDDLCSHDNPRPTCRMMRVEAIP